MVELPVGLVPRSSEELELQPGVVVEVRKSMPRFEEWHGEAVTGPFGSKPLINLDGDRLFAEIAILRMFENAGWNGRWIQTYSAPKFQPHLLRQWAGGGMPGDQTQCPIEDSGALGLLGRIAEVNGGYSGCWDVFAWTGDRYLFAEAKRSKKDAIRGTQLGWLSAALDCGLSEENFLLVEWSF